MSQVVGMTASIALTENAKKVIEKRYLKRDLTGKPAETPDQMFRRVARTLASVEVGETAKKYWEDQFYSVMSQLEFLPNSPAFTGAESSLGNLSACFVLPVPDNMDGILKTMADAALIHRVGGGTGFNFSDLRPSGDPVSTTFGVSSGPVAFMFAYNHVTEAIKQGGTRRGANMGLLSCDHPDIEEFITCKDQDGKLSNFNISVVITDKFMNAVENEQSWDLINPRTKKVEKTIPAKELFGKIVHQAWKNGEPGLFFLDTTEKFNPTPPLGPLRVTNPCGEVPLRPYESCVLGSINLVKFVNSDKTIDWIHLRETVQVGTRALDNIIDSNTYSFKTGWSDIGERIAEETKRTRKIGLGVMGFADMLIKMQIPYNSEKALEVAEEVMKFINDESFEYSKKLGEEKGSFPAIEQSFYNYKGMCLRNSIRTVIAPTGTISIMANSTSSGIEPVIFFELARNQAGMKMVEKHWALEEWEKNPTADYPSWFVESKDVPTEQHIRIQAAFQKHTNNAVSKTINLPHSATEEDVRKAYFLAWKLGCKGITVYRDGSRSGQVLSSNEKKEEESAKKVTYKVVDHQNETPVRLVFDSSTNGTRPSKLPAFVERIRTTFGNMYVTVSLKDEKPFEVFVQVGKGGFEVMANAEALGRLISLALRNGINVDEIYDQLKNIGGGNVVFDNGYKITSIPDAISKVLAKWVELEASLSSTISQKFNHETSVSYETLDHCPDPECKGTLRFEGRCYTCNVCGQSKC